MPPQAACRGRTKLRCREKRALSPQNLLSLQIQCGIDPICDMPGGEDFIAEATDNVTRGCGERAGQSEKRAQAMLLRQVDIESAQSLLGAKLAVREQGPQVLLNFLD